MYEQVNMGAGATMRPMTAAPNAVGPLAQAIGRLDESLGRLRNANDRVECALNNLVGPIPSATSPGNKPSEPQGTLGILHQMITQLDHAIEHAHHNARRMEDLT